jgi:hypothetical protein
MGVMKAAAGVACVAVLLVGAPPALACDCPPLKPPTSAVRTEAPIVFEGQVVEIVERSLHITRTTPSDSTGETRPLGREVVFQVTRAWAGVTSRRVSLFIEDGDCTFTFEAGQRYVVFATRDSRGRATTTVCTRTQEADRAEDVLKALGQGKQIRRSRG